MIKNNIEVDVRIKCIETGMTQAQLGEAIGTTGQYVNTPVVLLTNKDYEQEE